MPAVQTTYATFAAAAYPGMVANGEWVTNIISRIVDPATANAINFGDPVLQGASEQTVQSANGGSGVYRGIAVRDTTLPPSAGDQYLASANIGVMTKGVIWVNAAVTVSAGQAVYITSTGTFTDVSTSNTAIPGAIWDSTTIGAGLAKLRLN